jgi:hypothetical protein
MRVRITPFLNAALATSAFLLTPVFAEPVAVPFDFSRGVIGLDATIGDRPVYALLDTGVDPSAVDIHRAETLGLKIDRSDSGEISGVGDAQSVRAVSATLDGLVIGSRGFGAFDALASDLSALSNVYGRPIDAILGYSFLKDTLVLVDYPNRKVVLLDQPGDVRLITRSCRQHWYLALQTFGDDNWPIIPQFHFGSAVGPASLDTGSNGGIALFPRAFRVPGLRAALVENGEVEHSGFRGVEKSKTYVLHEAVGFGPFTLPAGSVVKLMKATGASDRRVANVGNELFAALNLKILFDYAGKKIRFYGNCGASPLGTSK